MSDDLAQRRWLKQAANRSGDAMEKSGCMLAIFTASYREDPLACLQFGIAMVLDKPIFIVAPYGSPIPDNVKRVARGVAFYTPGDQRSLDAAMRELNIQGAAKP